MENAADERGDDRALRLNRLVAQYERSLARMCYAYLRDEQLAEDAVQETFVKAYRALDAFRGGCSEKTWLMRIAMNTCKDMRKSAWFRCVDRRVTPEELPLAAAEYAPRDEALTLAVMGLPRKLKEAVLLYYYQSLTVTEIGQALGISAAAVSGRLRRAREKLRDALEGETEQ